MLALPDSIWLLPLFAALAAAGLAIWILIRPWSEVFHRRLTLVLALTALVELSHAALLFVPSDAVFFRQAELSLEFLRMGAFFLTGAALIVGTSAELGSSLKRRSRVAVVAGLVGALFAWWGSFSGIDEMAEGAGLVRLGPNGRWLQVALLLGLVLAIAQLESVLRASRDPFRFRIKFLILGLCALAGFEVYVASQTMLLGSWRLHHAALSGLVTIVSVGLVAFGLGRMRLARTLERVSVSPQAVYGSFTLLGVGLYLLGVGLLGEALRLSGRTLSVGFTELGVFVATLALVAAVSSRAVRTRVRELVSRNLLRSRYDYRTKWLEVTDAFRGAETVEQVLDRLLDVLGRTFAAPRLSIFMRYEADDRFHQVRSLNIEAPPAPIGDQHPVVVALSGADEPTDLRASEAGTADAFLVATRAVFGVPLRGAGELLGFVTLGPRPGGEGYDVDDRDMLRAIAHHAGVLLGHARMADDRQASAELDALNRFAAFYLHDFKNLAARLSLVTQNAAKHGEDPEFRAESMKTIARTAEQMGDLMAQLSRRSPDHGPRRAARGGGARGGDAALAGPRRRRRARARGRAGPGAGGSRAAPAGAAEPGAERQTRRGARRRQGAGARQRDAIPGSRAARGRGLGERHPAGAAAHAVPAVPVGRGGRVRDRPLRVEAHRGVVPGHAAAGERGRARDARGGGAAGDCLRACGRADFGSDKGEDAMKRRAAWAVVLVAAFTATGCGMLNDFRKTRHTKAANRYVAEKKWKEATIEFRTALRYDPENLAAGEGARAGVLRQRAARRGLSAAAALQRSRTRTTSRCARSSG